MHFYNKQFIQLVFLKIVLGSGFGKCPNFPSMPKFNIEKVSIKQSYDLFNKTGSKADDLHNVLSLDLTIKT